MRERRQNFRVEWHSPAEMYDCKGRFNRQCIVRNFSNGGASIAGVAPGTIPEQFILRISPHGRLHRCRVVWRSKNGVGVTFAGEADVEIALASRQPETKRLVRRKREPV
jgi:hypothetical protein